MENCFLRFEVDETLFDAGILRAEVVGNVLGVRFGGVFPGEDLVDGGGHGAQWWRVKEVGGVEAGYTAAEEG